MDHIDIKKLLKLLEHKDIEIATLVSKIDEMQNTLLQLDEIIAKTPGHIYWLDRNNVFLGCNDNQAQHANLPSRHDIVGKTNFEMPWKNEAYQLNQANYEVMHSGITKTFEESAEMSYGKGIFLSQKTPLRNKKGEISGILGISFDITERKNMEAALKIAKDEAEQANKAKSEFMEFMTHELRTPLTGMLGILHNLLKRPGNTIGESQHSLDNLRLSGELLLAYINDILDYAKLRKGQFDLFPAQFNLEESIHSTTEILTPNALKKNIKIIINYPNSIPKNFYADKKRINQILFNLIGNGVKFTRKGSVKVTVECLSRNKNEAKIKISISDTGPGIPKDKHEFIFNKFEQLKSTHSSNEQQQGTGLGLAIVRQLVNKFQGKIELDSVVGKGSTFHVTLPLLLKEPINTKIEKPATPKPNKKSSTRNVLLVEDNLINQAVIEEMLQDLNCHVIVASNGKQALNLFDKHFVNLVLLDLNLPDIDGITVAEKIRKKSPEKPIVILTANNSDECILRCKKHGINTVIGKPVIPAQLENILKAWLA